ncbi:MAG: ABC transporter permease [Longimicrobiaceae bacterium]
MSALIALGENALLQGLSYGVAVLGVSIAFRVLRYPDLTPDGSFLLGAAMFAAAVTHGAHWSVALMLAVMAGACAGLCTGALHFSAGVNRLLSGILTSMACYSIAFRVLSGKSNIGLPADASLPGGIGAIGGGRGVAEIIACLVFAGGWLLLVVLFLRSELGLVVRASGANAPFVAALGRRPDRYQLAGLAVSNSLVAASAALVVSRQGFADVNMGIGVIVTLVAAMVIGEEVVHRLRRDPERGVTARAVSGIAGTVVYFLLYLVVLRASILGWIPLRIQPTDLKIFSAVLIVVAIVARSARAGRRGDALLF